MKRGQLVPLRAASAEQLSDEGLVAACATGDRAACGLLFERYVDAVYRFAARMRGSDASAVDDLVQATFVAAFAAAGRYRGASVRSWLFGIAANQVRMFVRSEIRRKRALANVADRLSVVPPVRDPARDLEAARVPAAVAALPIELREVLVLVDLEGEKGWEAAAALGIPEGTLWRRLFDARQALRASLGGVP
ncbi:MAG TPA: RNA polymerase sigma factor [Kofleriaceae bacterium]|jgi:RNA polymerase sigma-70 factor (ECF subfamily)